MKRFEMILGTALLLAFLTLGQGFYNYHVKLMKQQKVELQKSANAKDLPKSTNAKDSQLANDETKNSEDKSDSNTKDIAINWKKSSEDKPYPDLAKHPNAFIKVSVAKQRVYIMDGKNTLYTMYASTGSKDSPTPTGTYHIQAERGPFFYNASSKEGAKDFVSFKDHGIYLFHTVPTDKNGNFVKKEADQLGKKANSHGCVRLAVPDAQWVFKNVPEGMKVEIH